MENKSCAASHACEKQRSSSAPRVSLGATRGETEGSKSLPTARAGCAQGACHGRRAKRPACLAVRGATKGRTGSGRCGPTLSSAETAPRPSQNERDAGSIGLLFPRGNEAVGERTPGWGARQLTSRGQGSGLTTGIACAVRDWMRELASPRARRAHPFDGPEGSQEQRLCGRKRKAHRIGPGLILAPWRARPAKGEVEKRAEMQLAGVSCWHRDNPTPHENAGREIEGTRLLLQLKYCRHRNRRTMEVKTSALGVRAARQGSVA
jgi:hypothetical protein